MSIFSTIKGWFGGKSETTLDETIQSSRSSDEGQQSSFFDQIDATSSAQTEAPPESEPESETVGGPQPGEMGYRSHTWDEMREEAQRIESERSATQAETGRVLNEVQMTLDAAKDAEAEEPEKKSRGERFKELLGSGEGGALDRENVEGAKFTYEDVDMPSGATSQTPPPTGGPQAQWAQCPNCQAWFNGQSALNQHISSAHRVGTQTPPTGTQTPPTGTQTSTGQQVRVPPPPWMYDIGKNYNPEQLALYKQYASEYSKARAAATRRGKQSDLDLLESISTEKDTIGISPELLMRLTAIRKKLELKTPGAVASHIGGGLIEGGASALKSMPRVAAAGTRYASGVGGRISEGQAVKSMFGMYGGGKGGPGGSGTVPLTQKNPAEVLSPAYAKNMFATPMMRIGQMPQTNTYMPGTGSMLGQSAFGGGGGMGIDGVPGMQPRDPRIPALGIFGYSPAQAEARMKGSVKGHLTSIDPLRVIAGGARRSVTPSIAVGQPEVGGAPAGLTQEQIGSGAVPQDSTKAVVGIFGSGQLGKKTIQQRFMNPASIKSVFSVG